MGAEWWEGLLSGTGIVAVLGGIGLLVWRVYKARGGFAKESAEARVTEAGARVIESAEERKTRQEDEEAELRRESIILKEYKELSKQQRVELAEHRKLLHETRNEMQAMAIAHSLAMHKLANDHAECKAERVRADERIAALEQALDDAKIPHRKWVPADGSGGHKPLPPTTGRGEP